MKPVVPQQLAIFNGTSLFCMKPGKNKSTLLQSSVGEKDVTETRTQ